MGNRKRDEKGFVVPTIGVLFGRMLDAACKLEPQKAAVVGMHFERWVAQQPGKRWIAVNPTCKGAEAVAYAPPY